MPEKLEQPSRTAGALNNQNTDEQVRRLLELAVSFHRNGRLTEALGLYEEVLNLQPNHFDALHLSGVIAAQSGNSKQAVKLIRQAIQINPNCADAFYNYGNSLQNLRQLTAAVSSYQRALALQPDYVDVYNSLGMAQDDLKQYQAALVSYDRAMAIYPDYDYLYGNRLHTKLQICDWRNIEAEFAELAAKLEKGEKASTPLTVLAITDNLALQRKAAEVWSADKIPHHRSHPNTPLHAEHGKIRIGYFSADFRNHPVAYLIAELLEKHDRRQLRDHCFFLWLHTKDAMKTRLEAGVDRFIDVGNH